MGNRSAIFVIDLTYFMITTMKSLGKAIVFFVVIAFMSGAALAQVTLTINKSNNAPTPVPSGVPFTYTIGYSWSGGIPAGGTLIIQDALPTGLDPLFPYTNYPSSTTISGNTVTYTQTGITTTAGSGVLQVYAAFKVGVTCNGTRVCDTARVKEQGSQTWISSAPSCSIASATNNWTFENELYAGCAACPANEVIFRVKIINPAGWYGGLNMTNMKLTYSLPAGAVINSVNVGSPLGPTINAVTGPTGFTRTPLGTNSIIATGDPTTVLSVYWYWQTFYVHVSFPCNQVGNTIISNANLNYNTPCDTIKPLAFTDTAKVVLCQAIDQGTLYKDFQVYTADPYNPYYYPNTITPNCCGTYRIFYTNTGTVAQTGVVITDTIPGAMDVNQFYTSIPAGMGPVKEEVWKYPTGPWTVVQAARTTSGTDVAPIAAMPISKIRWTYSGSMPVSTTLVNTIDVCVRTTNFKTGAAVVPSQLIVDTVAVDDGAGLHYMAVNTLTVSQTSPHLIAEKAFVGTCDNSGAHPGGPWFPGDIVRFRIAVANLGSATATPVTLTDLLPAGFSYQGGETYYYGPILPVGNWLSAYTPACNTFTSNISAPQFAPLIMSGALTSPPIGTANPTNCIWTFPALPARCDGTPYYFIIEFDVKVTALPVPTLPGTYANNFTISATNATSATSNNAYVVISSRPGLIATKEVRSTPSGIFGPSATIIAGGTGEYRITVKNTGNVPLINLCLLDILPHTGDIGVLQPYAPRGSLFNIAMTTPLAPITNFTNQYYANAPNVTATGNPSRLNICNGFCLSSDAPGATVGGTWGATVPGSGGTYSFKVSANATYNLPPGGMLQFTVPFTVPISAKVGDTACNSFAYQCSPFGSTTCLAAEPIDVCIKVVKDTSGTGGCCPCDSAIMAPTNIYNNIQTQWKTITIFNLHCSPIDSINLRYYDCSTGLLIPQINLAALNGGNLHVYRNPSTNVTQPISMFNASNRYQHMPLPVNTLLPAYGSPLTQDRVSFDLGLNYFLIPPSWCIKIIIYHANGDSCVSTLPRWTPAPPTDGGGTGGGIGHDSIKTGTVYGVAITVDPKRFDKNTLGYISATVSDSTDIIVGGSGALWESQSDNSQLPRPLEFVQSKRTALFKIASDSAKSLMQFYVFLSHTNGKAVKPKVTIGVFDNESNMIATDTIQTSSITSAVNPTPGTMPQNQIQITSIQPNPARNSIEVQYLLGASDMARLEIFNTLGVQVGVLADGFQTQGEHTVNFMIGSLPEGSYYLRLSTNQGQASAALRIIH